MGKVGRKADTAKGKSLALHENTVLSAVVLSEKRNSLQRLEEERTKERPQEGDLVKPLEDESR